MSNGGWFGLGLGTLLRSAAICRKLIQIFVFSIVIEEFGFFGASLILGLTLS